MSSLLSFFQSFIPGPRLIDGGELKTLAESLFSVSEAGLTAKSGGGAGGPTLEFAINLATTVAADHDSVTLPPALAGRSLLVYNDGAHILDIYAGAGADVTAFGSLSGAAATHVSQNSTTFVQYTCYSAGHWKQGPVS